jgi:hypothetical protein
MVRDYGIYGNLGWGRHWLDFYGGHVRAPQSTIASGIDWLVTRQAWQ